MISLVAFLIVALPGTAGLAQVQKQAQALGQARTPSHTQDPVQDQNELVDGSEFKLALDDETSEKVDGWIEQLSSPDYAQRQAARTNLGSIGAPSFAKLRDAYQATDELEVRLLIESMVKDAYIRWHARANKAGFLGITSRSVPLASASDKRVAPGSVGLIVTSVMPGTPAELAGLRVGDIIVALEGQHISAQDVKPFRVFAAKIQKFGPGRRVRLSILRGKAQLDVTPILGRPNSGQVKNLANFEDRIAAAVRRFPIWWVTQFRQDGKPQQAM